MVDKVWPVSFYGAQEGAQKLEHPLSAMTSAKKVSRQIIARQTRGSPKHLVVHNQPVEHPAGAELSVL